MENSTDNQSSNSSQTPAQAPVSTPQQQSPQDTSNWDGRPIMAPDGRVHIDTFKPSQNQQSRVNIVITKNLSNLK